MTWEDPTIGKGLSLITIVDRLRLRVKELLEENKALKRKIDYYESGAVCGCTPNDPDGSTRHSCPIHGYLGFAEAPDVRFY